MWKNETDIERITFGAIRRQPQSHAQFYRSLGAMAGDTVTLIMPQGIPVYRQNFICDEGRRGSW